MKCECEQEALVSPSRKNEYLDREWPFVNHKPHKCKCTNDLAQFKRSDGSIKWLCSCCNLFDDVRIVQ